VLYARARRRRQIAPTTPHVEPPTTAPPPAPSGYCIACGKAIPLEARFCKYCGAKQG